jgi:hypothetical protein
VRRINSHASGIGTTGLEKGTGTILFGSIIARGIGVAK